MQKHIQLSGLDCAACALELEEEIRRVRGVRSASVDFMKQRLSLECDDEETLEKVKRVASNFEEVKVIEEPLRAAKPNVWKTYRADILCIAFSAALLLATFFIPERYSVALYVLYALSYASVAASIVWTTVKNLAHGRIFDENFLMTIASIGAICLAQYAEAIEVMLLYRLGELLQNIVVGASRKSIADLMDLKSESATVLTENGQKTVTPEQIEIGDVMLVKAGEKIAVDGVVVKGRTALDVKSLSGEAAFADVSEGDAVLGGSINAGGVIEVRAEKAYSDSTVAKILDLVENSTAKKAKPEKFITKFAKIYTPVVCLAAAVVAFLVPLFTGNHYADFGDWVYRALVFLVISCPCALVISVPLSYFSGIGFAAKHGILVKGSTSLDTLARTKIAAFDKTGTLTLGDFCVSAAHPVKEGEREFLLAVAAAAEQKSSHPLARAFAGIAPLGEAEDVFEISGRGIKCRINDKTALVGNAKLLAENGVAFEPAEADGTLVYAAYDNKYLGFLEIEDKIKENARESLAALKKLGVSRTVMLTGDNSRRAEKVAAAVGLDETYSELLPDQKLEIASKLKKEGSLTYVGDGINDAPVLIEADTGVSMGGVGSDAAIEASDAVLVSDDLSKVPLAVRIARKTRAVVVQNIAFSIAVKLILMVLGLLDIVPLWVAVLADVGVMMLAVLNSFRTRTGFSNGKGKETACTCGGCCERSREE